jgi:hypothetical protein
MVQRYNFISVIQVKVINIFIVDNLPEEGDGSEMEDLVWKFDTTGSVNSRLKVDTGAVSQHGRQCVRAKKIPTFR